MGEIAHIHHQNPSFGITGGRPASMSPMISTDPACSGECIGPNTAPGKHRAELRASALRLHERPRRLLGKNLRHPVGIELRTTALAGPDAPQRAALIMSLVAGVQMMRQAIGLGALAEADNEKLVELLAPLFERLVKG